MKGKRAAYEEVYGSSVPPLHPRVESSIRFYSVRVYLHDRDDYEACCQVFQYGTRAFMFSIHGAGFYKAWDQIVEAIKAHGASTIEGYVMPDHARLLRVMSAKTNTPIEIGDPEDEYGRTMSWVRIGIGGTPADTTGAMPAVRL